MAPDSIKIIFLYSFDMDPLMPPLLITLSSSLDNKMLDHYKLTKLIDKKYSAPLTATMVLNKICLLFAPVTILL